MTPYEAWHGKKPAVSYLRTFGCLAYVKDVRPHLPKLSDCSKPMVLIGYADGAKAYKVFDPVSGRVQVSRDVIFDEGAGWDWDAAGAAAVPGGGGCSDFTVEYLTTATSPSPLTSAPSSASSGASASRAVTPSSASTPATLASASTPATPTFVSPPPGVDENLDAEQDDCPLRYRSMGDLLGNARTPGFATRDPEEGELHLLAAEEPASFTEAEQRQEWRRAMLDEIASIEENNTWRLVDLPSGHRAIGLKWVFKLKKDAEGRVAKHKARLVAKGYVQQPGIDFEEVFALVARLESVRLLLAQAAQAGWTVHHMDVKSAFLNGELAEEVYVKQPPGFVEEGREHQVLRLDKALYGLRQAPRAWNSKLDATLLSLGFRQNDCEHAVYVRGNTSARLLVGVYVDDLIITGTKEDEIVRFKGEMKALFKMSDLGLLSFYLGIEVEQVAGSIRLSQAAYARRILERAGMLGCNPSATPMEQRLKLSKTSAAAPVNPNWYRGIVGCLRYLVHTRPDIAFSVGYVSRFMEAPTTEHEAAVKRILRYIAGTTEFGCHYHQSSSPVQLVGYSDADMAGDPDTRKSTTGVVFFLGTSPVSWQSVKQKVVALSSCEAEYIAATTAACQGVWLSQLLGEVNQEEPDAFKLLIDNKSAIALSKNPVFHERSKHIATRYHYIRERVGDGSVHVEFVRTEGQIADILTKALGRTRFQELRSRIGVADVKFRCKT